MAQFSVNATRFDPYKNFKFRVKWDGRYVAGISKVGALKRTTGYGEAAYQVEFEEPLVFGQLIRSVTPLVRYGWLDVDTDRPPDPDNTLTWDRQRWTLGVITEVRRTLLLKIEYCFNDEDTGDGDRDTNELLVQLEIFF